MKPPAPRAFVPKYAKPIGQYCEGCLLETDGRGYVPGSGTAAAPIVLVGEGPWFDEVAQGIPFVGAAGAMLTRVLKHIGRVPDQYRIDNCIRCFPGDTSFMAGEIQGSYRRWYSGQLVLVHTREGVLSGTPNHPVMTSRGWVPMHALVEGDDLLRGILSQAMLPSNPDVEQAPVQARQLHRALANRGTRHRVVERHVDFHGDGGQGEIDVVRLNCQLWRRVNSAVLQQLIQFFLEAADLPRELLNRLRAGCKSASGLCAREFSAAGSFVSGGSLASAFFRSARIPQRLLRHISVADFNAHFDELVAEPASSDMEFIPQSLECVTRQIATAQILKIDRSVSYTGRVYNLHTKSGEYLANGFIVHNCAVPSGSLEKWPEPARILATCRYLDHTLASAATRVVVPMGQIALRRVLGLPEASAVRVQDFHGTVQRDPTDSYWVVPTYHPSHLSRGATNLIGVSAFDLARAQEVAEGRYVEDVEDLILDPPLEWFRAWGAQLLAALRQDPFAYALAVDVETPEGTVDKGEKLIAAQDDSYRILRVNFSCHPEEGVTVPFEGDYIPLIFTLLAAAQVQYYWFKGYDYPRLRAAGAQYGTLQCLDLMWAWKALQSDLPMGLGMAAPFYCHGAAWKHLAASQPAQYGAIDGVRTRRTGDGILRDLQTEGRLDVFLRHQHRFHAYVLQPATDVGLAISRERLTVFRGKLDQEAARLLQTIQDQVPAAVRPETPKAGLTRPPAPTQLHSKATDLKRDGTPKKAPPDPIKAEVYKLARVVEKLVLREVGVCKACGAVEVAKTHRCADSRSSLWEDPPGVLVAPIVEKKVASVRRWFWVEPFNPDSVPQLLSLGRLLKLTPGRDKKTGNDSVGREVLQSWAKQLAESKDPARRVVADALDAVLDYKAVAKVRGTYAIGVERRLDEADRVHGQFTFKPSTMRLSGVNPNLQNVVADKGGKATLAAGFRSCVVARGRWVEEGSEYADEPPVSAINGQLDDDEPLTYTPGNYGGQPRG